MVLARERRDGFQILEQLARIRERRIEIAALNTRIKLLQQHAVGKPAAQARGQPVRGDSRGLGQHHRFGHQHIADADDGLVDDLGRLPGARGTHVGDVAAELGEHRVAAREIRIGAAGHDGQRALARRGGTAGHGTIYPAHACLSGQPRRHVARSGGIDGRQVDQQLTAARGRCRDAAFAEHAVLDGLAVEHAHQHDVAGRHNVGGRGRCDGAMRCYEVQAFRFEIPRRHLPAALQQPTRHRLAHEADADETKPWSIHVYSRSCALVVAGLVRHRSGAP